MCYRTLYIGTGEPARSLGGALDLQPKDGHLEKPFQRLMGLSSGYPCKRDRNPDGPVGYFLVSGQEKQEPRRSSGVLLGSGLLL